MRPGSYLVARGQEVLRCVGVPVMRDTAGDVGFDPYGERLFRSDAAARRTLPCTRDAPIGRDDLAHMRRNLVPARRHERARAG